MFPRQISEAYSWPDWQYGDGRHHAKGWFRPTAFQVVLTCRSTLSHQETNHTSLLFFACLHFQYWTNTLYTTLTRRAIKKQLCRPRRLHYACLLPYRSQYRYATTVLPALRGMFFMAGVRFSFDCPLHYLTYIKSLYENFKVDSHITW